MELCRCNLREDPAPLADHPVPSEVRNSQVFLGRLALLEWPVPPSHPTPTPTPEEGIMGQ